MHNSRLRATLATGIATLVIGFVGIGVVAAPASAASGRSLPEGSSLYAISCDNDLTNLSVFSIDAATAAATPVGEGTPDSADCAGQAAYNPATSVSYFVAWQFDQETEQSFAILATVDPETGVSLPVSFFSIDGAPTNVDSIAIGNDGAAYAIYDDTLYSLDLATGALTELGDLGDDSFYGFSVDPTTGAFYAVQWNGDVFTIDIATHTATLAADTGLGGDTNYPYSLQIDSNGTFWLEADAYVEDLDGWYSHLWSISGSDLVGSALLSGVITAPEGAFYTESLLLVPGPVVPVIPAEPVVEPAAVVAPVAPQLANTGVDAAPIAAGGALVALLGLALPVPAIRRRATA